VFGLLRFLGLLNTAIWLGTAVFVTFAAGPAFFSEEMLAFLPKAHSGRAAQLVLERYFALQCICAGIAVAHLFAEWLLTRQPVMPFHRNLLLGIIALVLFGGFWLAPRLQRLHPAIYPEMYYRNDPAMLQEFSQPERVEAARKSFALWHGVSQMANLLALLGLVGHFFLINRPSTAPRFGNRFRSP
jgi:hypothetical protein